MKEEKWLSDLFIAVGGGMLFGWAMTFGLNTKWIPPVFSIMCFIAGYVILRQEAGDKE